MTKPKVVFDPFSEEYFTNPFDIYRRMREDAPLYYDEKEDFYALTRHEDVAAALKDFETFSSTRGCDLAMVRKGISPEQRSIIFMDPPEHRHMRSLVNKAFTPRAIQSQHDTVVEVVEKYLGAVDPDHFDVVEDFSGPFPVEVITTMAGVPPDYRQQVRHWIDTSLHREPGQIELSEEGMQANVDTAMYYYSLVQERRAEPQDDMISRLIAAEIPTDDGTVRRLDDIEICGFATLLGRSRRQTRLLRAPTLWVHTPKADLPRANGPANARPFHCQPDTSFSRLSSTSITRLNSEPRFRMSPVAAITEKAPCLRASFGSFSIR